ncbi:hypothetical protein AB0O01_26700 [Streptomyces sp. NPDC093252]|uniref:hypothetical protein n=1 Tax=Streptomyces sp. NPDC093252 TaxID=3154980 RepID=UPI0034361229
MTGRRETWTTDEFGASHTGAVGVLLDDGTVPGPAYFDIGSGSAGEPISHWSVYDGRFSHVPRAAALQGVCSCGWSGPAHPLDWDAIGDRRLDEAGAGTAYRGESDWDAHTTEVAASAVPVPEDITRLLEQVRESIEKLGKTSPLAAVRAVRRMEVTAEDAGYWAARGARGDASRAEAATALGLDEDAARKLLARLGRWSPYFS